jgi:hypothetical protein
VRRGIWLAGPPDGIKEEKLESKILLEVSATCFSRTTKRKTGEFLRLDEESSNSAQILQFLLERTGGKQAKS